jgi:outer membrane protein assembly factor BamB
MRALRLGGLIAALFVFTSGTALALPANQPDSNTSSTNDRIRAVAQSAGRIFVGGDFTQVNGRRKQFVARLNANGRYTARWRARTNGRVYALALSSDGSRVFVAGAFTKVNGVTRRHLAAVSAATGRLVRSWRAGTDGTVRALAMRRGWLYLGGDFKRVRGKHRVRLAALNPGSGRLRAWHPFANRAVRSLALSAGRTRVFAGGDFTKVAGPGGRRIAREHFVSIGSRNGRIARLNPRPGFTVNAIQTVRRTMYLGMGGDGCPPGSNCNAVLAYSTTGGTLRWRCQGDGDVHALTRSGAVLYVAGHWQQLLACPNSAGNPRARLMALNRANGSVLAWRPGSSGYGALAISARRSRLAIGGDFNQVAGNGRPNYAQFTGNLSSKT